MNNRKWIPWLVYAVLALAILGPLLSPGYVLTLDMVFTPHPDAAFQLFGQWESVSAQTPLLLLQQLLSAFIPGWVIQKIILLLIFFLAGLGAHKLFSSHISSNTFGGYFAGILYTINPFTYTRLIAGNWTFLFAYALTPFAIKVFLDLLENGGLKNIIKTALLTTLVGIMYINSLFLLFLVFFVIFIIKLVALRKNKKELRTTAVYAGLCATIFLVINLYWVVPVFSAGPDRMAQIGGEDLTQFAPTISNLFDLASMNGFWNLVYIDARQYLPFWPVLFIIILFLAICGFIWRPKDSRTNHLSIGLVITGIICFILAIGITLPALRGAFEWLYYHTVVLKGFRDSQKFIAMLCLAYAFLGGLGVNAIYGMIKQSGGKALKTAGRVIIVVIMLVPLVYTFVIFGTFGQLKATDYPDAWYKVNDFLKADKQDFNVLFLPWHQYMDYDWIPNKVKRQANPAWAFFVKPAISGDNYEISSKYSESANPVSKYVEFLLDKSKSAEEGIDNLGELLAPLNVKYIILVNEADYESYDFLFNQEDISVEMELDGLTLFRNEHQVNRAYAVDGTVFVKDWDEFLALSRTQDVTGHLYLLGDGEDSGAGTGIQSVNLVKENPAVFRVMDNLKKYLIFTVPQLVSTDYWQYNGDSGMKNLGVMPAFASGADGGVIKYTRFYRIYLPSYLISAAGIIAALFGLFYRKTGNIRFLKK